MTGIELNDADEKIIDVLTEGRNTPANIARRLNYTREYVANRLKRLVEHDVVEKPDRGLYELAIVPQAEETESEHRSEVSDESNAPQGSPDEERATHGVREVLEASGWRPGQNREGRKERLHAAVKALKFLRDRGEAEKADFLEVLHPEHAPEGQNEDTYWAKVVRGSKEQGTGALGVARNAGLVEREHGPPHIYRWVRK